MARAIMFQGTASHVGKSVLTAALCRILHQDGWRVAPFKAQNMSLNSGVTPDGGEIGRAQLLQAQAAGVVPTVDMNPILLKPKGDMTAQVIVHGRPLADLDWRRYRGPEYRGRTLQAVRESLARLQAAYDVLVLEGAGSPAEVNLRQGDIVNMTSAELADARVLLVGDIDRGGVIAALVGTLQLLAPEERARVGGLVVNLFRGDASLFDDGVRFLEAYTGLPVLGVIPYLPDLGLEEEDAVARGNPAPEPGSLDVAVVRLPHISNFTDFDPLAAEPGVAVRYVDRAEALGIPDALVLPGSKNSVADLLWLYQRGLAAAVLRLAAAGVPVVGICGGFQMLGRELVDGGGVEADRARVPGLDLLPVVTAFEPEKLTLPVTAEPAAAAPEWVRQAGPVRGYEIHTGRPQALPGLVPLFAVRRPGELAAAVDGAVAGEVLGSYLHGLFENHRFRRAWLNRLRERRGLAPLSLSRLEPVDARELALDRLAAHVRQHLDLGRVYALLGLPAPRA